MSTGMPELGSKISLISKADIRYEGRLFTVDPQECTIALASVRSFGTEDRETQYPVAPQNQVYDYILFRGSDIKDIRVVNTVSTLPNDPAIMQLSVPPSLGQQQYQPQGFSHPVLGPMGPQMPQNYNPYGGLGNMGGIPSALAPGMNVNRDMRNMSKQPSSELINNVLSGPLPQPDISTTNQIRSNDNDLIGGGSRSTTPQSLISRKSPTMDAGVQAGAGGDRKSQQKPIQPPSHGHRGERKDSRGEQGQNQNRQRQQDNRQQHDNRPMHDNRQQHENRQQHRGGGGGGGWGNQHRGNNMRQRGFSGNRGRGNMYRGPPQQPTNPQKPKNTLKFDNDYDFEQANTEFEELRSKLAKTKISDDPAATKLPTEVNGDNGDLDKKDDSGNETGAGEQEPEDDQEVYYDKSKSFFDNISCEAVERSKGRSQRTDWRTERKLNSETFGVSSTRRGGYRGRGGYYRGGMYRGGYRGNYRGGQNRQNNGQYHQQQRQNNQQSSNDQSSSSQPPPLSQPAPQQLAAAAAGK